MYTIAHLILKPDFRRTWPEAVAVVREVATVTAGLASIPGPADLLLTDDGRIEVGFASEVAGDPVTSLGTLLAALIEGTDPPPGLQSLAEESAGPAPRHATPEDFQRALEFFERPGRQQVLARLAGRLRHAGMAETGGPEAEQELDRLRAKLAGAEVAPAVEKAGDAPLAPRRRWPLKYAAAIVAVGVVSALAWRAPDLLDSARVAVDRLTPPGPDIVLDVAQAEPDARETARAPRRADARPGARVRPPGDASPSVRQGREVALAGIVKSVNMGATPTLPTDAIRPASNMAEADAPPAPAAPDARLYTAADPQVAPPRLLRRQLPTMIEPTPDTGYFDLVVDASGRVESVRLVSKTRHYHERMLMAAAKAWQFAPARRDDEPVRFRVLIPITFSREW